MLQDAPDHGRPLYDRDGICPLSNQVLGFVADLRDHPAVPLMRTGVRITISPDDPAMFGYTGVTLDFVAASVAWDLSLEEVKRLLLNSIEDAAHDR